MNQYLGTWGGPKGSLPEALQAIHRAWPDKVVIISEFGFESGWNRIWGPPSASLDPAQYYFIPEDISPVSEAADVQRQRVIQEQMAIFRTKPFVAGTIFWTYQDYRTPTQFIMGVVDAQRNKRASWQALREEYSPVLIDSLTLSSVSAGNQSAKMVLRARGPIETDLPAYTLRGYILHWAITALEGVAAFSEGDVNLPVLAPGATWTGEFVWQAPAEEYVIRIKVLRPTGFPVLERAFNVRGEPVP